MAIVNSSLLQFWLPFAILSPVQWCLWRGAKLIYVVSLYFWGQLLRLRPIKPSVWWSFMRAWAVWLGQGLPYIPRVHLSEGSLVRSPLRWLCSEEPMVRRSFIPKFLYSESCYVPKIPYSERPPTIWILCYEGSLVRSSSSPKVLCSELPYSENRPSPIRVLYYEGPFVRSPSSSTIAMFRRFYLPNVYGWPSLP